MNNIDRFFTSDPIAFADAYLEYLQSIVQRVDTAEIGRFIETLLDARVRSATVFVIGNGGSAATASHFANDIAVGTNEDKLPFRVVSLTDNIAAITAIANDFGYEHWVAKALEAYADPGDLVILISSSGKSPNMLNGARQAKVMDLSLVTVSGFSADNPIRKLGDLNLWVDSTAYNIVEMTHHVWLLAITDYLIATKEMDQ